MFKAPFSFRGRIRRKEFVLSFLLYVFLILFFSFAITELTHRRDESLRGILVIVIILPCLIFMIAQGVKRSHDIGNSGWFLLIPLYMLVLVFAEGENGDNRFGSDPKRNPNATMFSFEDKNKQR